MFTFSTFKNIATLIDHDIKMKLVEFPNPNMMLFFLSTLLFQWTWRNKNQIYKYKSVDKKKHHFDIGNSTLSEILTKVYVIKILFNAVLNIYYSIEFIFWKMTTKVWKNAHKRKKKWKKERLYTQMFAFPKETGTTDTLN